MVVAGVKSSMILCVLGPCKDPSLKPFLPGPAFVPPVYVRHLPPTRALFFPASGGLALVHLCVLYRIFVSFSLSVNHLSLSLHFPFSFLILSASSIFLSFFFKENIYWLSRVLVEDT